MSTVLDLHTIASALPDELPGARVIPSGGPAVELSAAEPARDCGTPVVLLSGRTDEGHKVTLRLLPGQPVTIRTRA